MSPLISKGFVTATRVCRRCRECKLVQAFGSASRGEQDYCKSCLRNFDPHEYREH